MYNSIHCNCHFFYCTFYWFKAAILFHMSNKIGVPSLPILCMFNQKRRFRYSDCRFPILFAVLPFLTRSCHATKWNLKSKSFWHGNLALGQMHHFTLNFKWFISGLNIFCVIPVVIIIISFVKTFSKLGHYHLQLQKNNARKKRSIEKRLMIREGFKKKNLEFSRFSGWVGLKKSIFQI